MLIFENSYNPNAKKLILSCKNHGSTNDGLARVLVNGIEIRSDNMRGSNS